MSHLITTYALACGVGIDKPNVKTKYYPLPFTRYITVQTGAGQAPKQYSYWQEIIVMLAPALARAVITVVHLGAKDDQALQGVYDLRDKTDKLQSHYLISKSMLHVGNDSWLCHCAGWCDVPTVALYGSTSVQNHGPYPKWGDPSKRILISSHRGGGVPTYSAQENPKTIDLITPESVCNAVISLLGLSEPPFSQQTRLIGILYNHAIFELIPNTFPAPSFMPESPVTVRMDYLFREDVLRSLLQTGRKVNIVTNKPIDVGLLGQFRPSILSYTHEIDTTCPLQYAGTLGAIIQHRSFFTKEKDEAKIAALRYHFFDICDIQKVSDLTKDDYVGAALTYLNREDTPSNRIDIKQEVEYGTVRFKSNKYLLSDGKMYLSRAHLKAGRHIETLQANEDAIIDDSECWENTNHYLLYNLPKA